MTVERPVADLPSPVNSKRALRSRPGASSVECQCSRCVAILLRRTHAANSQGRHHGGRAQPGAFAAAAFCRPRRQRENRAADHRGRGPFRGRRGDLRRRPRRQPGHLPRSRRGACPVPGVRRAAGAARVRRGAASGGEVRRRRAVRTPGERPPVRQPPAAAVCGAIGPTWRATSSVPCRPSSRLGRACCNTTAPSAARPCRASRGSTRSNACWKNPRPPRPSSI